VKYFVRWRQAAEDDLLSLWLNAPADREEISRISQAADRLLERDAHLQGEAREGRRRILFVEGFGVTFDVYQNEHIVRVLGIWRTR